MNPVCVATELKAAKKSNKSKEKRSETRAQREKSIRAKGRKRSDEDDAGRDERKETPSSFTNV